MKVFCVEGEHPSVPGHVMKLFANVDLANAEAASLVNLILEHVELPQNADAANWRNRLRIAQDKGLADHGNDPADMDDGDRAEYCDVWITEMPVEGWPKPANIVISLEGGAVQFVGSDQHAFLADVVNTVMVVDYDTDGADEDDLVEVLPAVGGDQVGSALLSEFGIHKTGLDIPALLDVLEKRDAAAMDDDDIED